jgi:ABC-type sugar transport system ATPase subunit
MITLKNVSKRYTTTAFGVRDLNFEIQDQEFLVIYGPSGAGKSTTLKLLAGIIKPTAGDIERDGQSLLEVAPESRDMAMAFENYALYSHMSVRDNLAFPLRAKAMSKTEIDERVNRMARTLQISDLLDRRPGFLSGGQRQRVALGRAIIRPANLYLLDEPIGHLDAKLRNRMRGELKAMSADMNATIVLVTTASREALALGERIAILREGNLQQIGTPDEVYYQPVNEFVASFVGEPPMSFLNIVPMSENGQLFFQIQGCVDRLEVPPQLATLLNGQKEGYRLGVRASEITVSSQKDAGHQVSGEVYIVEHMGYSNIITSKLGNGLIRVITGSSVVPNRGEIIWLSLNAENMHLFYKTNALQHPSHFRNELKTDSILTGAR